MQNVRCAIIDDGIDIKKLGIDSIDFDLEITSDNKIVERRTALRGMRHGTTCAAIIKKYYPYGSFGSIKILNSSARGSTAQLTTAIKWCIENNIRLINLSLGSIYFKDYIVLKSIINEAYKKGIIIVAAKSNQDMFTIPASFDNVLGVKCDIQNKLKKGQLYYSELPFDGIEITAKGRHALIENGKRNLLPSANSYAAAYITSFVYEMLCSAENLSLEQIKYELHRKSINFNGSHIVNPKNNIDWVNSCIVFHVFNGTLTKIPSGKSFKILDYITIDAGTFKEGIELIKAMIGKMEPSAFDAIAIICEENLIDKKDSRIFYDFTKYMQYKKYDFNLIYLNESDIDRSFFEKNLSDFKVWHPVSQQLYRDKVDYEKMHALDNIPIIFISNYNTPYLLTLLSELEMKFRNQGYQCSVISSDIVCTMLDMNYLNINQDRALNTNEGFSIVSEIVAKIHRVCVHYNTDVVICGLDNLSHVDIKAVNSLLKLDIFIGLYDDCQAVENTEEYAESSIAITNNSLHSSKKMKAFKPLSIEKVFKYIIKLLAK